MQSVPRHSHCFAQVCFYQLHYCELNLSRALTTSLSAIRRKPPLVAFLPEAACILHSIDDHAPLLYTIQFVQLESDYNKNTIMNMDTKARVQKLTFLLVLIIVISARPP